MEDNDENLECAESKVWSKDKVPHTQNLKQYNDMRTCKKI